MFNIQSKLIILRQDNESLLSRFVAVATGDDLEETDFQQSLDGRVLFTASQDSKLLGPVIDRNGALVSDLTFLAGTVTEFKNSVNYWETAEPSSVLNVSGTLQMSTAVPAGQFAGVGGHITLDDLKFITWLDAQGSKLSGIYHVSQHSGGGELIIESTARIALAPGLNGAIQLGLGTNGNNTQYVYLQNRGYPSLSEPLKNSLPFYCSTRFWDSVAGNHASCTDVGFQGIATSGGDGELHFFTDSTRPNDIGSDGVRKTIATMSKEGFTSLGTTKTADQPLVPTATLNAKQGIDNNIETVGQFLRASSHLAAVKSGTGAKALTLQNNDSFHVDIGTDAVGWAKVPLSRNLTTFAGFTANGIDCTKDITIAGVLGGTIHNGVGSIRVVIGDTNTGAPVSSGSNVLTGKGWGFEIYVTASVYKLKLFAFDSSYSQSTEVDFPFVNNGHPFTLQKTNNTLKLWMNVERNSRLNTTTTPLVELTGAPTTGLTAEKYVTLQGVGDGVNTVTQTLANLHENLIFNIN